MRREAICTGCDELVPVESLETVCHFGVKERTGVALVANDFEAVELTFHYRCYTRWVTSGAA